MKHPDPDRNLAQEKYLRECSPEERRFLELSFKVGNATFNYHLQAKKFSPTEKDWLEWLEGLPGTVRAEMRSRGFQGCQTVLSFTRYVNEKNDVGLEEYLRQNIDPADLKEFNELVNNPDKEK